MSFLELPVEEQIELATRAAQAALPRYDLPSDAALEVVNHRENTVLAVVDGSGRKLGALRVHVPGYQTRESILSEFRWMAALESVGVRTPQVQAARDGEEIVTILLPESPQVRFVDLFEWIDGRQPGGDEMVESFRLLGDLQARCHRHASNWALPPGFTRQCWDDTTLLAGRHPVVAPAWENWALSEAQRGLVLAACEAVRARLLRWGKGRERYGIIHSDLMPENLIITDDGVRLIDFDDAGFGWYLYDAASALLPYYGSDLYDALLQSWASGYRVQRPLGEADLEQLPSFLFLRCVYALGWLHRRRNSPWAEAFIQPVIEGTTAIGTSLLGSREP
jgi:Ser/Thr protein kinase RdoA (MazF antagonist)